MTVHCNSKLLLFLFMYLFYSHYYTKFVVLARNFPGQIVVSSGTGDKVNKSGTVPDISGRLEPMKYIYGLA